MRILKHFLVLLSLVGCVESFAQTVDEIARYGHYFPKGECDTTAFVYALRGYRILNDRGLLANSRYLSIVDFTKPSNAKRLFVLDVRAQRTVIASIAAHGIGSDPDSTTFAYRFSNHDGSKASSIGFYITGDTYFNHRPLDSIGLCLFGLDKGYNDSAAKREIVIHYGATEYKGHVYVTDSGAGRSYGCPALPLSNNSAVISRIKGGSCLFIYSDKERQFAHSSSVLNRRIPASIKQQGPPPNNCSCQLKIRN